jgi:F-type H+-transporting ATPase subunit b
MSWNFFSFFLNNEETFIELNTNILETNVINIAILVGLLIYGYKVSISVTLENRQKEIVQTIENAQKDVLNASNYFYLAEKGFTQSLFWLQSWKVLYEEEKIQAVQSKYKQVKLGLLDTFETTAKLVDNFEKKAFLSLQRYILYITASRILRNFLILSQKEQSKFIEVILTRLGGFSA